MGEKRVDNKNQLIKIIRITMTAILVLAGLVIMVPRAFSYLSATQERGIAIRAATAAEIWEMQGSFEVNCWKANNHTGISIYNKSPRDLWIFFEYTGDMKQVFKQSGPVLVKAGETCPVILGSLDEDDSPRVPNPLDLIEFQSSTSGKTLSSGCLPSSYSSWQWKTFAGHVKIHTLNSYATLEFPAQVSGSVLWDIYFSNICGLNALELSTSCTDASQVRMITADVNLSTADEEFDDNSEDGILQSGRDYLTRIRSYQPLQFIAPIQATVERIAPGLWQEHEDQKARLYEGADTIQRLINMVIVLTEEKQQLENRLEEQQLTIHELYDKLENVQATPEQVASPDAEVPVKTEEDVPANPDEVGDSAGAEPVVVPGTDANKGSSAQPLPTEPDLSSTCSESNWFDNSQ